jgi:hypothetical protein
MTPIVAKVFAWVKMPSKQDVVVASSPKTIAWRLV